MAGKWKEQAARLLDRLPLYRVRSRLVNKLVLLFTSIIVLVVTSLTFISYQMIQRESVDSRIASTTNNLLLVNQNLEDYLAGLEQSSLPQLRYDEITRAIETESESYSSRMYLENYLRNLYYSRKDLNAIYLYIVKEGKYYAVTSENYNVTVRSAYMPELPDQPWYRKAMESPRNHAFQSFVLPGEKTGYAVDTSASFMAYHRVLRTIATREPQAVLSFYVNPSERNEIMGDIPFGDGEHLLFLNPDNVPFYADDPEYFQGIKAKGRLDELSAEGGGKLTWEEQDSRYMVVYNIGEQSGWKLVKPIRYSEIYAAARTTRNLNYLIGAGFLAASVILIVLTARAITRPLQRLAHQMNRFSSGAFEAAAEVRGRDEIAYLSRHFNEMVERTNELINERYKMKLVEQNAILKALEAEINPHFLYNALQAISTMALKNGTYDIADMIDNLAMTLRYCIGGKDVVQAGEELKHIERYLALQQARFGSRLQVEYEWDEPLRGLMIPKLSIQTLVENAIKHAVERMSVPVTVVIGAELSGDDAIIFVRDNGPGIPPERLRQVLALLGQEWEDWKEHENIGLKNLDIRLNILYGDLAGLDIRTGAGGTEMRMIIPRGGGRHV